jgi:glycosyltransferase involved in cell wall biosynthesis
LKLLGFYHTRGLLVWRLRMSPAVSICIPTFSRLNYLQEAVASARAQTFADIEILIGDDGDSPELRAWCLAQAGEDARVRYHKTPRRLGLAGNWNFLAQLARGRFLNIIGDDDRLLPAFVERLLAAASGETAVVFCNHFVIDSSGTRLDAETRAFADRYGRSTLASGPIDDAQLYFWRHTVPMSPSLARSADVQRFAFKEDINTPESELYGRMVAAGKQLVFVADYLMEYRVHPGSATARGLTVDRLAEYLEGLDVPAHIESAKRNHIEPMALSGVGRRLARGDVVGARALAGSRYYPSPMSNPRALLQRLVLALPDVAVPWAYGALLRSQRLLKAARARPS